MNEVETKEIKRVLAEVGKENALLKRRLILIEEELKKRGLFEEFKGLV